MSKVTEVFRLSHIDIMNMKNRGEKVAALTSYDSSFAALCQDAGVDIIFVGDSLGMVVQGHETTLPVTLKDMIYHISNVVQGCQRPLIIGDLPFGSYQESPNQAFSSATKLSRAGAQVVKLEGGEEMALTTKFLSQRGIAVCAHVGLMPQSINQLGGYKVQGREEKTFAQVKKDALAQEKAGAVMIVLEAVPAKLADELAAILTIPTIGIGASASCSGQVLVIYDILDIVSSKKPRFVKNFMVGQSSILAAVTAYVREVKNGVYPSDAHLYP